MPASLADIARSLNVSMSLVSKVLSGKMGTTGATPEAVAAIRKRAAEMGYVKNSSASSLATGRQNVIGVYIHQHGAVGSGLAEAMVMGISAEALRHQQRLMLTYYTRMEEFIEQTRAITPNMMDSLIVAGVMHEDLVPTLKRIARKGFKIVTVMDWSLSLDVANIGMNQATVGETACEHLLDRKCKRLAHINVMSDRFRGFNNALRKRGLNVSASHVYKPDPSMPGGEFGYQAGVAAVEHFLASPVRFDGIVAQSDLQAIGAMHTLLRHNIRIPEDVRVIGVDNAPYCDFSIVPLSSVSQQEYLRGTLAVRHLMGPDDATLPEVNPVLVARASA